MTSYVEIWESKEDKLERTLTEVIEQLKSWRQEIKLTEVECDFE